MGCFLACFGSSKDDKRRKIAHNVSPRNPDFRNQCKHNPNIGAKQENIEKPISLVPEYRVKQEVKPSNRADQVKQEVKPSNLADQGEPVEQPSSGTRKKVTFNLDVKHISIDDKQEIIQKSEEVIEEKGVNENCEKPDKSSWISESDSTLSSLGSYPSNYRYLNCGMSYDEDIESECEVSDLGEDEEDEEVYGDEYCDDEDNPRHVQELSTKNSTTRVVSEGHGFSERQFTTPEFNRGARNRGGYVHSVLNPVANATQWKAAKSKGGILPLKEQKENFPLMSNTKSEEPKNTHDVAVDTSLSTWLVSSQKTPLKDSCSVSSFKGIPNTTSKYREDKKVNWHSTPFETRLERALKRDAAEALNK